MEFNRPSESCNHERRLINAYQQGRYSHSVNSRDSDHLRDEIMRNERELQAQREHVSKQDKKRIMQYSIARVIILSVITVSLITVTHKGETDLKSCSQDVHQYLTYCSYYFGFCAFRQLLVATLIPCTQKPYRLRDLANVVFIAIDIFLFTAITFFGTKIMFSDETKACRDNGTDILMMWIFGVCCLLYGWVYCLLLACGLTTLPLILVFWCVYRMQMNEIVRED